MTLLLFLLLNSSDTTVKQPTPQVVKHDPSRACGSYVEIKDPKQRRKHRRENRREGRGVNVINVDRMNKTKTKPVMLGSLAAGANFEYNGYTWQVMQQLSFLKTEDKGLCRCRKVNTSVILDLPRGNYVTVS